MASARDQVAAYAFAARRQAVALLRGEDSADSDPRRRLNRSALGGILLTLAIVAAVGVTGLLSGRGPSDTLPRDGVIIAADDGGAYVLIDGVLHPALNLASARLISGSTSTTVSTTALATLPRGLPVGIPGAPDALPAPGRLTRGAWSACSIALQTTAARAQLIVTIGASATARPFADGVGLPVRSTDGSLWLLENGLRFRVDTAAATLLGLDRVTPTRVLPAVLDVVPEGPPLAVPTVPRAGQSPAVSLPFRAAVGDLIEVDGGGTTLRRYVVLTGGVAPVDPVAAQLLAGAAQHTVRVAARDIASATPSHAQLPAWPQSLALARPPEPGAPLCITYRPGAATNGRAWNVELSEPATTPLPPGARPAAPAAKTRATAATGIAIPPSRGALVHATGTGGLDGGYELITDSGLRYPVADTDAVGKLGYAVQDAVTVPLPFVGLLPSGPALDRAAASAEYRGTTATPATTSTTPSNRTSGPP